MFLIGKCIQFIIITQDRNMLDRKKTITHALNLASNEQKKIIADIQYRKSHHLVVFYYEFMLPLG